MITITKADQQMINWLEAGYDDPVRFVAPYNNHSQNFAQIKDDTCTFCEEMERKGKEVKAPDSCYNVGCDGYGDVWPEYYGFGVFSVWECSWGRCEERPPDQDSHPHITYRYGIPLIYDMINRYPGVA